VGIDTFTRLIQFAAILLETAGVVLIALLFGLIRRQALHRRYFASWGAAWTGLAVAITAIAIRYFMLGDGPIGSVPESAASVRALYLVYQCAKFWFWALVCRGALEYVRPEIARTHVVPLAIGAGALTWLISPTLVALALWQAPAALFCCVVGAMALLELPPTRSTFGTRATASVLLATAILWAAYAIVFARSAGFYAGGLPRVMNFLASYNSYIDVLMQVMLGFAMIVQFMEEARLRVSASESRLAALVAASADATLTMDRALTVLDVNTAAESVLGLSRDRMVGASVESLVPEDDRQWLHEGLRAFITSGDSHGSLTDDGHLRALGADGASRQFEATVSSMRGDEGFAIALSLRDVTARRAAEERERQREKMDAVRQLAGGLAHDFNDLLTAIVGQSQILARALPADSSTRTGLGEIEQTAGTAARLARGLLSLSRREVLTPEHQSMNGMLRALEPELRETVGSALALDLHYAEEAGDVYVDPDRFREIILSLVRNACEAMENRSGTVRIGTARITRPDSSARNVEMVGVSIGDDGAGFSADARHHLFEPFFSTKGEGRGLGLATAFAFLQQSGGWIDVQSGSHGTTVRVALPFAASGDAPTMQRRTTPTTGVRLARTVLVAEDEDTVRRFVRIVLEKEGMRVLEATNGIEALAVLEREPEVDVLLTDVVMPQMGGLELADRACAARTELKVVFMSGFVDASTTDAVVHGRATSFLQKPFDIEDLARVVREQAA
jgi:PAS domain S-box-containing protein